MIPKLINFNIVISSLMIFESVNMALECCFLLFGIASILYEEYYTKAGSKAVGGGGGQNQPQDLPRFTRSLGVLPPNF